MSSGSDEQVGSSSQSTVTQTNEDKDDMEDVAESWLENAERTHLIWLWHCLDFISGIALNVLRLPIVSLGT